ncbi:MAG: glycosyltransferase family 92 protein [Brevundimonas sp.]|nr:glycosyltransferase family 92 protein [Brevundimonas sp.]
MQKKLWNFVVVSMFKDEAEYFEEWICHYIGLGVDHFVLYNNNSVDNSREVLFKYINRGIVTLIDWPMRGGQVEAFNHAATLFGRSTEWVAFLDVDEFLIFKGGWTLGSYLDSVGDEVEQIILPWRNFSFSGHKTPASGLITESFLWASKSTKVQTKHVVRTSALVRAGVHSSLTKNKKRYLRMAKLLRQALQ